MSSQQRDNESILLKDNDPRFSRVLNKSASKSKSYHIYVNKTFHRKMANNSSIKSGESPASNGKAPSDTADLSASVSADYL